MFLDGGGNYMRAPPETSISHGNKYWCWIMRLQLCAGEREFDNFQLVEKTYIPDDDQSGGVLSNLDEEIEVRGPLGEIEYRGNGSFIVEGKKMHFSWVTLILGGSGITSGYQLIARTLETEGDSTGIAVIGANKSEADILSKEDLQLFKGNWESMEDNPGLKNGVSPEDRRVALLYGPPATTQKAALPARRD